MPLTFALVVHNHQPVGNFDSVFQQSFREAYLPFINLIAEFPEISLTLHMSGPLLKWLTLNQPSYLRKIKEMAERGQVEILGGAYYEPILTMLPKRDRLGQIVRYKKLLEEAFSCRVRGMWLAERVWSPDLVTDLVEAGIEYTLLDDYHFKQAGVEADALHGYYLTEDQGNLLRVFPINEKLRYLVPWQPAEETASYLKELNEAHPNAITVCADDGEKFGSWPSTFQHCYEKGWLKSFFTELQKLKEEVRYCTLAEAMDQIPSLGNIYLPDASYREMLEWALPTNRQLQRKQMLAEITSLEKSVSSKPKKEAKDETIKTGVSLQEQVVGQLRGGYWRNFVIKYPEVGEMYARMMEVSKQLASTKEHQAEALLDLYAGQCNCPYWHGAFGGLYLPHLRHAIYKHLIAAENALQYPPEEEKTLARIEVRDFNMDSRPEVKISSRHFAIYAAPHMGGMIYELDVRPLQHNLLGTLNRRPEPYHETIRQAVVGKIGSVNPEGQPQSKEADLDKWLIYDSHPRKALVDHFFPIDTTLEQVRQNTTKELGDFIDGAYIRRTKETTQGVTLRQYRQGFVDNHEVHVSKEMLIPHEGDTIHIRYRLHGLPEKPNFRFAVEFHAAGLAYDAEDRFFYVNGQPKADRLNVPQDHKFVDYIGIADGWLGLDSCLRMSQPGGMWAFPIVTVSQSEGGFEKVYQSVCFMPHWKVTPNVTGEWSVELHWQLDTSSKITNEGRAKIAPMKDSAFLFED